MPSYHVVGGQLLTDAEMLEQTVARPSDETRMLAGVDGGAVRALAPLGVGRPLSIEIRHVYTGKFPRRIIFGGSHDMLLTSAIKAPVDFPAAPRAINFLHRLEAKTNLSTLPATEAGTPLIFHIPSVVNYETSVTIEMAFDNFPKEAFDQFGSLLKEAAGIPVFATASTYLLAGSVIAKLAGSLGERIFDGNADFQSTLSVNFDATLPLVTGPGFLFVTDSRMPIDRMGFEVDLQSAEFPLVAKGSRAPYDGDCPYVVLRLQGEERPDYKDFRATLVSADLLDRFYHVGDKRGNGGTLVDAMKLYSDVHYRRQALEYKEIADRTTPDSDAHKKAQALFEAYAANISEPDLKPKVNKSGAQSADKNGSVKGDGTKAVDKTASKSDAKK